MTHLPLADDPGPGGLDREDDIADVRARHDYFLGLLTRQRVDEAIADYHRPLNRSEIVDLRATARAELWDQATTPEYLDVRVDYLREIGRGER